MIEVHNPVEDGPSMASDLASRLASRICHDLTSPLGAIANGVELLILSGAQRTPEIDLISESIDSANARIRFFRLAYGTAGSQPVGRAEILRILADLGRGGRHSYEWMVDGDQPREEVKMVFLLLQCLEATLPVGGQLRTERHGPSWVVTATGPRLRPDLPGWAVVQGQAGPRSDKGSDVCFALLADQLTQSARTFALSHSPEFIEARI
jgi:histidine phosphotransferase ChpT